MVWTDTFADHVKEDFFKTTLSENNERLAKLNEQDIRVIIGNPPYSVGQESANDNNQNERYELLDRRIAETYVLKSLRKNNRNAYDSFSRAYRWASDRIGNRGIIGFVTNASFLKTSGYDGMRRCMAEEFSSIYIYHLKGNQRTSGERSRQEGGKIFGEGSRAPVAIVILIKNPEDREKGKIYFHEVDDYLTREEKLNIISDNETIKALPFQVINPDAHGDWFSFRDSSFDNYKCIADKNIKKLKIYEKGIFSLNALGLTTSRDAYVVNSSRNRVVHNLKSQIDKYNSLLLSESNLEVMAIPEVAGFKWSRGLKNLFLKNRKSPALNSNRIYKINYRPFFGQFVYFDRFWNEYVYSLPEMFPEEQTKNLVICINQNSEDAGQIALMSNRVVDLHFNGDSQCVPRYIYEKNEAESVQAFGTTGELWPQNTNAGLTTYTRKDAIRPEAIRHFKVAYPGSEITADDVFYYIYGLLHSEDYRTRYANNLIKELPRIPRVKDYEQFVAFRDAGKELANIHVNFESVETYKGVNIVRKQGTVSYRVTQMKWGKIPGKKGNAAKDKTKLIYNEDITIENIPLEAQEYVVNKKSALDWIVERACVKTDKDSGIVNDFNDYAAQKGDPAYPLDLFLRVITVSLKTMEIVKDLPALEIHNLDKVS